MTPTRSNDGDTTKADEKPAKPIKVTANANLQFASAGETVEVDPSDPEIQALIERGLLEEA